MKRQQPMPHRPQLWTNQYDQLMIIYPNSKAPEILYLMEVSEDEDGYPVMDWVWSKQTNPYFELRYKIRYSYGQKAAISDILWRLSGSEFVGYI